MDLTPERLQSALSPRFCEFHPQIDSTSDRARDLLAQGVASGSVVIADEQTRGRGRMGHAWYAPPGTALMLSYLLHPTADQLSFIGMADQLSFIGMMGALAVCETIESFGARARIKWPNDVQIDGRKLCGVLPEALWQDSRLIGVILGIGLNIRIDFSGTRFASTAVSLESIVGPLDRVDLLMRLLERLDDWSANLSSDLLFDSWCSRLNTLGQRVSVGDIQGVAETVDRQGALLVRDDTGVLQRVIAGDIALG